MVSEPLTNLYNLVRKLKIVNHKKRQEFLCDLVEGMIRSKSVLFSSIAENIDSNSKTTSIERRIQDFFQKVEFDYKSLCVLLVGLVNHEKINLSVDRTEWDYGSTQINILCITICVGKMGIPIYFEMLDNNSGNSNHNDRIALFKEVIELIGKERVGYILMDREFIGHKWLRWLKDNKLNFCVRVPKNHRILFADGSYENAEDIADEHKTFHAELVAVDMAVVNVSISKDEKGDLLYLIGTAAPNELKQLYKKRWTIEVIFQALKERGFNLESSCLRDLKKYKKLFAITSISYALCWAVGIEKGKQNPTRVKSHGYPQYSVFRRGLNIIREEIRRKCFNYLTNVINLLMSKILDLSSSMKTIG